MDNNIRPVLWTTLMLSLLFFLSACTNQVEPEETTLRVGLLEHRNISGTKEYYTQLYQIENPHVDFEFMAATHDPNHILMSRNDYDSIEQMTALMAQTPPPDVVILDYNDYNYFAREGKLIALDDLIRMSDFSTEDFHPTVIEGLRNPEDHLLYGLTLSFDSLVLVYNKDIFIKSGVDPPSDHMTWDEIFSLAQLVTSQDGE